MACDSFCHLSDFPTGNEYAHEESPASPICGSVSRPIMTYPKCGKTRSASRATSEPHRIAPDSDVMPMVDGRSGGNRAGGAGAFACQPSNANHRKRSHNECEIIFALLSSTCSFSPPAWYSPYATFELGKEVCARRNLSRPLLAGQQALLFRWY